MTSQVLPMWNGALSRARAFEWQGVTLKFPARSRSGVRADDGMVVFALPAAQVRVDDWGCSCVLWLPALPGAPRSLDQALQQEMLRHCRTALIHGMAEGFLIHGDEMRSGREELLSLRVVKTGEDYWAKWGSVARTRWSRQPALAGEARL
jgi:hypothetical protein